MNDFARLLNDVNIDYNVECEFPKLDTVNVGEGVTEPKNKVLRHAPTTLVCDRNQQERETDSIAVSLEASM